MPAAGIRRMTRVFGVVTKGPDSARVLRSGRRLWPDSGEAKTKRGKEGDDWPIATVKAAKGGGDVTSPRGAKTKREEAGIGARKCEAGVVATRQTKRAREEVVDKRFGIVYSRKRKRVKTESLEVSIKKGEGGDRYSRCVLAVVVEPCASKSGQFSCLLNLLFRYIKRVNVTVEELSAFFLAEPIHGAFGSRGMQFLQGPPTVNMGTCQFFGVTQFVPLLRVDFSAIPLYFDYLHSAVLLRFMFKSFSLVHNPINSDVDNSEEEDDFLEIQNERQISSSGLKSEPSETETVTADVIEINDCSSLHSPVKVTKIANRNGQYRNILNTRGIRKRRSSLRKRKARNPSVVSLRRSNGAAAASDLMGSRKSNSQFSGVASNKKLRSLANCKTTERLKDASSIVVDSSKGVDSSLCSANILVTESDQCYRVEGAIVTLEMSASKEWLLAVKKDGLTRCTLKAEKVMRPCSSNRFTHAMMFSLDNGWKLEFANRQDWTIFRDLYKACSDRNIPAFVAKVIPVPGVREVFAYGGSNSFPFQRPDTYISAYGDELTRAMTRTTANYDMDSEDEDWLSNFNNEFEEHVSDDNFELIIDALEKFYYYNPDDLFDEKSATNSCLALGSKEVIEAVYTYWMRKRKQKRSLLIRVFQAHQSKKAPLIPKPLLRKRRSFKRQPSQFARGNQPSVLKAFAAEQDALEENAMLKIEEAKASANISMELAVKKRKRAQSLAENADLATYKAAMLIRIAEAALASESVDDAASYFLD